MTLKGEREDPGRLDVSPQRHVHQGPALDHRLRVDHLRRSDRQQVQQRHRRDRRHLAEHLQEFLKSGLCRVQVMTQQILL